MLTTNRVFLLLFISLFTHGAAADDTDSKRVWACSADGATEEDLHLVAWGSRSYIKLYDARIWGNHYREGDELRWDFGQAHKRTAEYSVILKPDGKVDYYDFRGVQPGEKIEASYHYSCRLAQS